LPVSDWYVYFGKGSDLAVCKIIADAFRHPGCQEFERLKGVSMANLTKREIVVKI
jgi:hypothetical protein